MASKRFPAALWVALTTVLVAVLLALAIVATGFGRPVTASSAKAAQKEVPQWTGTWAASPQKAENPYKAGLRDVTVRLIVRTTIGGNDVRIRLSNTFGTVPLRIGSATIGVQSVAAIVLPKTLRRLTFGAGRSGAVIPPGGHLVSDQLNEAVPAGTNLAVSLYLPEPTGPPTVHADLGQDHQTSYISTPGDHTADSTGFQFLKPTTQWFFLDGVDVEAPGTYSVVTLGDSITDGTDSTLGSNARYPDWLFERLQAAGGPYSRIAVLNAGIGGNELLRTSACCGASPSALDRLNSDVLSQPGVKDVIVLLGTNDILRAHHSSTPAIILGLRQLVNRVHARGLRVFGGTITPSAMFTPAEEQTRQAVNLWITTSGAFNGVIDFSSAVENPVRPSMLGPAYGGFGLHPNNTGYHAMADAVDLSMLLPPGSAPGTLASGTRAPAACLVQPSFLTLTPASGISAPCQPKTPLPVPPQGAVPPSAPSGPAARPVSPVSSSSPAVRGVTHP